MGVGQLPEIVEAAAEELAASSTCVSSQHCNCGIHELQAAQELNVEHGTTEPQQQPASDTTAEGLCALY